MRLLNEQNHIERRDVLAAQDDVTALEVAQKLGHAGPVEVWEDMLPRFKLTTPRF
jgi:hypothetical protein